MIIALEKESLGHTHVEIDLEEGAPYRILEGNTLEKMHITQ